MRSASRCYASVAVTTVIVLCIGSRGESVVAAVRDDEAPSRERSILVRLESGDVAERQRAQAELAHDVDDVGKMSLYLAALGEASPEVEFRVRDVVVDRPESFVPLMLLANGDENVELPGAVNRARLLLREFLATELLRRVDREVLNDGHEERLFDAGVATGLLIPIGEPVPFWLALDWVTKEVAPTAPIVIDPELDWGELEPVRAVEFLPSTAAGLIARWLEARDLTIVRIGLVWMIVSRQTSDEFKQDVKDWVLAERPLREEDDPPDDPILEQRAHEVVATDYLFRRLLPSRSPDDPIPRGLLARGLRVEWAGEVAVRSLTVPHLTSDRKLLATLAAGEGSVELDLDATSVDADPRLRAATLWHLSRDARVGETAARAMLSSDDARVVEGGCYLAGRHLLRALIPELNERGRDDDSGVAIEASIALAHLGETDPELADRFAAALDGDVRIRRRAIIALELRRLRNARRNDSVVAPPLLDRGDDTPAGLEARGVAALFSRLTGDADGTSDSRLLAQLAKSPAMDGLRAWLLAIEWRKSLIDEAWRRGIVEAIAMTDDTVPLRSLMLVATLDSLSDDDYRIGQLRLALRRPPDIASPYLPIATAELRETLKGESRGASVVWLDPLDLPPVRSR